VSRCALKQIAYVTFYFQSHGEPMISLGKRQWLIQKRCASLH